MARRATQGALVTGFDPYDLLQTASNGASALAHVSRPCRCVGGIVRCHTVVRRRCVGISTLSRCFRHPAHRASVPHGARRPSRRAWNPLAPDEMCTAGQAVSRVARDLLGSPTDEGAMAPADVPPPGGAHGTG